MLHLSSQLAKATGRSERPLGSLKGGHEPNGQGPATRGRRSYMFDHVRYPPTKLE